VHTFIISRNVLQAIMAMIMYSKGGETTSRHIWYLNPDVVFGMNLPEGRAFITNSIHCFWNYSTRTTNNYMYFWFLSIIEWINLCNFVIILIFLFYLKLYLHEQRKVGYIEKWWQNEYNGVSGSNQYKPILGKCWWMTR